MNSRIKVLFVAEYPEDAGLIQAALRKATSAPVETQIDIKILPDFAAATAWLAPFLPERNFPVDLLLLDLKPAGVTRQNLLAALRDLVTHLPVVVISNIADPVQDQHAALEILQAGAQDYLRKEQITPQLLIRSVLYALERARTEAALRANEARYRLLAENVSDVIWIMDQDLRLVDISPSIHRLLGYSPAEAVQLSLRKAITRPSFQVLKQVIREELNPAALQKHLEDPYAARVLELEHIRKDGSRVWTEVKVGLIAYTGPQHFRILGVSRDISERKQAETAITRRAQELEALYVTSLEINSQRNLPALLQSIVERSARLVGTEMGGLYLTSVEGRELQLAVSYNIPEEYLGIKVEFGEGLSGKAAELGQVVVVDDYTRWEGRANAFEDAIFRRAMAVPLKVGEEVIGVINTSDSVPGEFSPEEIRLVRLFADQAAIAIENARLYHRIEQLAFRDEMTKLYNRRGFLTLSEQQIKLARRNRRTALLIFIDIDHLKEINDNLGHQAGDTALIDAAKILMTTFRSSDVIARIGGDEFAVLALEYTLTGKFSVIRRLEEVLAARNEQPDQFFSLSMSIGWAEWQPTQDLTVEQLLALADARMYSHKRSKRRIGDGPLPL